MFASIDWDTIKGSVLAVALIILCMAPVFWWLYDSDRVSRYWQALSALAWAGMMIECAMRFAAQHDWWWAAFSVAISIVMVIVSMRHIKRERGRTLADTAPS